MSANILMIRKMCLYPSDLYLIQSDMTHRDRHVHAHIHINNALATCSLGLPNYYQLLYINKPQHKSSDESATPNTLEMLLRLAYCRPTGQIGRRRRWGGLRDRGHNITERRGKET